MRKWIMGILESLFGINRDKDNEQDSKISELQVAIASANALILELQARPPGGTVDEVARAVAADLATRTTAVEGRVKAIEDDIEAARQIVLPSVP